MPDYLQTQTRSWVNSQHCVKWHFTRSLYKYRGRQILNNTHLLIKSNFCQMRNIFAETNGLINDALTLKKFITSVQKNTSVHL